MFSQLPEVALIILVSLMLLIIVLAPEDAPTPLAEISRGPATIATDILGTHLGCVMESEEPEVRALMTEIMHEFSLDNWTYEMGTKIVALSTTALNASGCLNEN